MKKKSAPNIDHTLIILNQIDQTLMHLKNLNDLQQKSYLTPLYRRHALTHEKRLAMARKELTQSCLTLRELIKQSSPSEKISAMGLDLLSHLDQLSLDLISLGCLRFRVGHDAEALSLKEKILKFSATLTKLLEALPVFLKKSGTRPNLQLLNRQLNVLEEAFYRAYPLSHEDEISFSLEEKEEDSILLNDEHIAFELDDAYNALQAFLYTARITCRDIEDFTQILTHWRGSL